MALLDIVLGLVAVAALFIFMFFMMEARRIRMRLLKEVDRVGLRDSLAAEIRSFGIREGVGIRSRRLLETLLRERYFEGAGWQEDIRNLCELIDEVRAGELLLGRGLEQVTSSGFQEVISGCQTLGALGDEKMTKILEEVQKVWSDNPKVVSYAEAAIEVLGEERPKVAA